MIETTTLGLAGCRRVRVRRVLHVHRRGSRDYRRWRRVLHVHRRETQSTVFGGHVPDYRYGRAKRQSVLHNRHGFGKMGEIWGGRFALRSTSIVVVVLSMNEKIFC